MALLGRLILALVLALQSLPLAASQCCARADAGAGAGLPEAIVPDEPACPCCAQGTGNASSCSEGSAPECRCGMVQPEQPKAPPSESRPEPPSFVAILPPAPRAVHPERVAARAPWAPAAGVPQRSGKSIQSLLCVWMM